MPDENQQVSTHLSTNHRRVVSIRMRLLEESCFRLLELFRGVDSIFISRRALPAEKAERIKAGVNELRTLMGQAKSDLGLESTIEDSNREAAALVAAMTTSIEELHPRALKGYGTLPGPTERYLEDRLIELLRVMKKIEQALDQPALS
jgi:hypothetical protein